MIDLEQLNEDQRPDFCIAVYFERNTTNPERIFKAAAAFIESMQALDNTLSASINSKIKPVLLLEEIEGGSIKIWVKQFLELLPDDSLLKLDWRPVIGQFLVKAKHAILKFIESKKHVENRVEMEALSGNLFQLAKETNALNMPVYRPIPLADLAYGMKQISDAASLLKEGEWFTLSSDDGDASVTSSFVVTQESIMDLLDGDTISNETERILMVRRPDFLGDAMWDFRHQKKSFSAKIDDEQWLGSFRSGETIICPGDALRVRVIETTTYGKDGEVLAEARTIAKILAVIREQRYQLPLE